ncbi:phage tail tape measure protein, partial [Rhodococcus jostii]
MATIGYATLQIIPSLDGVSNTISTQLGAPLTAAGRKAGQDAGRAVADGISAAKAAVEKAAATLAALQNKAADATDKIAVAQAKYQALVAKGVTDVGRLAAAEAAVAKARRDSETATSRLAAAATGLARAEENAAKAAKTLGTESASAAGGVRTLGASTDTAESSLSKFGKVAAAGAGLAVLGKLTLDAGKAFLNIGETFATVNKTLQYTTGATGTSLDGMMESVNTIGKTSPKSLGEIATVLAKVSQRTNLTGADLEQLTKQVLKTSTVMGQDTDVNTLTQAFAAFGVTGKDASASFDELFKASRATGVSVNELAAAAVKGAPQFQQFGLSLGQSAALMGSLDKAGLNSDVILTGLNKAMVNFAKDGRKPADALNETIASIEAMTKAGNDAGAIDLAAKLFGTKGAGQFVNAVKSGAVSVQGLTAAVDANQQGILDAGGAIPTLSSAWALFKNNVMIALEPVATRVFGIFIDGLTW